MAIDPLDAALEGHLQAIVDASLAADFVIGEADRHERAKRFFLACHRLGVQLLAPVIFGFEMDTVLRQVVLRNKFPAEKLPEAYSAVDLLPVSFLSDALELQTARIRARQVAEKLGQPGVYDALYAALAEARGLQFWTADKRFAAAAHAPVKGKPGAHQLPGVCWIGDYDLP
jgi:predicted nucleic acid-binding protein